MTLQQALKQCGLLVAKTAQDNVNANGDQDFGGGGFRGSITVLESGDDYVIVGTPLFYGVWLEWGTGAYAIHGDGRPGWWVYVDEGNASLSNYTPSDQPIRSKEEAEQVCENLRKKGLNAFISNGNPPHPYLQPALDSNKDTIEQMLSNVITQQLFKKGGKK